jgi:gluconokinase
MSMAASRPASERIRRFGPVVVMGVSGCGKSSVGERLADLLGCSFLEGDGLHPAANIRKMSAGIALEDTDRWPWLDAIGLELAAGDVVVSCSALKRGYRDRLRGLAGRPLTFVFLQADRALLAARMAAREDHYMPLSLLDSQLATLEVPMVEADVVTVGIDRPLDQIVRHALAGLEARARPGDDTTSQTGRKR